MNQAEKISIVIPILNEEESIKTLYSQIISNLERFEKEIIFINDGSTDQSEKIIRKIIDNDPSVKLINFYKNYGKAAALSEAVKISNGEIIITIDGDLQDDPSEIPNLIEKINEGWDLVSGWKKVRRDSIMKILAAKIFNFITRLKTGIKIHDFNCGLKAYKKIVVKSINIYGGLHRFIPVLAKHKGFVVDEIIVNLREREFGISKYGKLRIFHGFFDLITILFLNRYTQQPLHLFGSFGISFFTFGDNLNDLTLFI